MRTCAAGHRRVQNPHKHHCTGGNSNVLGHEHDGAEGVERAGHAVEQKCQQHAAHNGDHDFPEGVDAGNFQAFPEVIGAGLVEQPVVVAPANELLLACGQDAHVRKGDAHQVDEGIIHKQQEEDDDRLNKEQVLHALPALNEHHHTVEYHHNAGQQQNDGNVHDRTDRRDGHITLGGQVEGTRLGDGKGQRSRARAANRGHGLGYFRAVFGVDQHHAALGIGQRGDGVHGHRAGILHGDLQAAVLAGACAVELDALRKFHAVVKSDGLVTGDDKGVVILASRHLQPLALEGLFALAHLKFAGVDIASAFTGGILGVVQVHAAVIAV